MAPNCKDCKDQGAWRLYTTYTEFSDVCHIYGASVHPENAVTYSAGKEGQKICEDLPETTTLQSYAAKNERKS